MSSRINTTIAPERILPMISDQCIKHISVTVDKENLDRTTTSRFATTVTSDTTVRNICWQSPRQRPLSDGLEYRRDFPADASSHYDDYVAQSAGKWVKPLQVKTGLQLLGGFNSISVLSFPSAFILMGYTKFLQEEAALGIFHFLWSAPPPQLSMHPSYLSLGCIASNKVYSNVIP